MSACSYERLLKIETSCGSLNGRRLKTLADELEVSERTIRDDLAFLKNRLNAPLEFQRTRGH